MTGGFIATAHPIVSVGIGIGDPDGHLENFSRVLVFLLMKEHDALFEIGIRKFPVAADAGVELNDGRAMLPGIGIIDTLNEQGIDELMGAVLFQDIITKFDGCCIPVLGI